MAGVMYVECFSGAAGDMLLGALLDAGLPEEELRRALGSLGVGHDLRVTRVLRAGLSSTYVQVIERGAHVEAHHHDHHRSPADAREHQHIHVHDQPHDHPHDHGHSHDHDHPHSHAEPHAHPHRSLKEIAALIAGSALSEGGKARAIALFRRLAEAEAAIHQMSVDEVHLHEVGATDSIIDIVGVVFGMEWFGVDDVVASQLNVGGGSVQIVHGRFPVPAPATLRLLTDVPVYNGGPDVELVTPTGALLVTGYAKSFGPVPSMRVAKVGYGAGTRDFPDRPNVLRVLIGERTEETGLARGSATEVVIRIECEIDDMSPQLFGHVNDRLFAAGALDVYLTSIVMKKGRPGTLVTVLSPVSRRPALCDVLFRETTTIGVRFEAVARETLERRWVEVTVPGGVVRIKVAGRHGETLNAAPEFEDCARIAQATGQPLKAVQAAAMRAWLDADNGRA